jgi:hypothetical protein
MQTIEIRAAEVARLWTQGDAAMTAGDHGRAYALYTQAHDLVMDCARLHEQAHRKLRTVTRLHANQWEFFTDSALVMLAPLGVFHLIAFALRSRVGASVLCRGDVGVR